MIDKTFVLTVRNSPKSVNAGGGGSRVHHMAAAAEKKTWEGIFLMEMLAARVEKHMEFCAVYVTVRFKNRGGGKGRDVENFRHPVVKPLLDSLVKGGYLKDDTAEWVQVKDFELVEGCDPWDHRDPRVKSEMVIKLEASYL